ncbi:hypothetical protein GUJ93_ZPchr0001g32677 [Zizania palustris]|uniref:Reverse transcriptase zinc-binding domain-containing protein n=1 Tax=Zizania palustris TaxID=103762 RepID=A0A8J5R5U6_ZIZPA|nr:hypothetical protein GUJ93_ZPchr0001g32677 [Zizania palustris]
MSLYPLFQTISRPLPRNGATISLWFDLWTNHPLHIALPKLFSFAKRKSTSLLHFFSHHNLASHFFLPLLEVAESELFQLLLAINSSNLLTDMPDSRHYIWGSTLFASHRLYASTFMHMISPPAFQWLWAINCTNRLKFFFWLLLHERLHTADVLIRKHLLPAGSDLHCSLCTMQHLESICHLFFNCAFSKHCWARIEIVWRQGSSPMQIIINSRSDYSWPFFMEIIVTGAWGLWIRRNDCIFRLKRATVGEWLSLFKTLLTSQASRCSPQRKQLILAWFSCL